VGKNAGTSITRTIKENLETEFSGKTHDSWQDIPAEWQDRGFTVIRDSYDRAVSWYLFGKRKTLRYLGFTRNTAERQAQLKQEIERYNRGFEWWLVNHPSPEDLLQTSYLPKNLKPIRLLVYENIHNEWADLCRAEGWPDLILSEHNRNPSVEISYDQYHTKETRKWVETHLSADIELHKNLLTHLPRDHQ
jgi:hypothetical protein